MTVSARPRSLSWNGLSHGLLRTWTWIGGARGALVAGLPLVLLVASPQRVAISVVLATIYLVAALVLVRPGRADRSVLLYATVAAAFIALMLLRMETLDPLNAAQRAYGLTKGRYFVAAVVPLALAAALLTSKIDDLRPAVSMFVVMGLGAAVLTLLLGNGNLFGESRYSTLGNVIAVGAALLAQFWIVRDYRIGVGLALITLVGILPTESKQSLVAIAVALAAGAIYWALADRVRVASGRAPAFGGYWRLPLTIGTIAVAVIGGWLLIILVSNIVPLPLPQAVTNPVKCDCMAGRFAVLLTNQGGRNELLVAAWGLFTNHPLLGAGLGAFLGQAGSEYAYPHNVPLEIASEMGVIGLLILLAPLVVGWVRLAVAGIRAGSPAVASAIMIVLVYLVVANLSGDLASERGFWIFGLVVLKLSLRPNPAEVHI